jgi:cysteinyl-tRNA synthetase
LLTEPQDSDDSSEEQVVFRKTHHSNLRIQTVKYLFDINKTFTMPHNLSKQDERFRDRVDMSDEKKELVSDLDKIIKGETAVNKIHQNETPRFNEFRAFTFIKNKYKECFEDDVDTTQPLEELQDVKKYVSEELKNNLLRSKKLKTIIGQSANALEHKRKAESPVSSDDESTTSKKSRLSPSDYIESLPTDHNPFDDIGD